MGIEHRNATSRSKDPVNGPPALTAVVFKAKFGPDQTSLATHTSLHSHLRVAHYFELSKAYKANKVTMERKTSPFNRMKPPAEPG